MAKRFTDTDKWKKPFIRSMKAPYKLLWLYILDECDHSGIWQVDFEVAQIKIGERLNAETALKFFEGRVLEISEGGKWFVYDFIEFQYGELNPMNRAHNSVIKILDKYKIDYQNKPLTSPLQGAKDMDKDKDMVKDMDMEYYEPAFKNVLDKWFAYKKARKESYKSKDSEIAFYSKLLKLSNNNLQTAEEIVEQSMANNWAGIFELKQQLKAIKTDGDKMGTFLQNIEKARQA